MTPLVQRIANLLSPLEGFYAESGLAIPPVEPLAGERLPEPDRSLLVHDQDMTSTLESFWNSVLRVRVLGMRRQGDRLNRQVVLVTDPGERVVEYGAIEIDLAAFDPSAREEIIACVLPLGAILKRHRIDYTCRPGAFFRVAADVITAKAFTIAEGQMLHGRHNLLLDASGRRLAEVVEILPPTTAATPNPVPRDGRTLGSTS